MHLTGPARKVRTARFFAATASVLVACGGAVGHGSTDGADAGGSNAGASGAPGSGGASGSVGTGGAGGGPDVSAEQACADYANAYCRVANTCTPLFAQSWDGDFATCVAQMQVGCAVNFGAVGSHWAPSNLEACARGVAAIS